ncbi:MAG: endonuclease/exonuclease/phosphatase family protein [Arcobacteraceae bacterium]|jgi:exonuclease III|nr:endonuclease/exonuclease/phosphatase family protein [Arcobacteraceae bacterium]MDY0364405.1 endonuclease/exonuclease/phosphatase family protein [Arcobacteraceae bacterium]
MDRFLTKFFIIYFILLTSLFAVDFKVASYNVENLFDLNYDKTEYDEYIPNKTNWNEDTLSIKLQNTSTVLKDLNADIIGLQEIESQQALDLLLKYLPEYKYSAFIKNPKSAIGIGLISKYKIVKFTPLEVDPNNNHSRPILEVDIKIEDKIIKIFVNHWRSKSAAESSRIPYAKALYQRIKELKCNEEYIILGDFNSNYNEFETFKYNRKLNDTNGITAINDILKTTINSNFITKENYFDCKNRVHYNLWLDLSSYKRFSYKFQGSNETPDSIIVSTNLFDGKNIEYINNSFEVFAPSYLYKKNYIQRWQIDKKGYHKKRGYSDHLPIFARFSTDIPNTQSFSKELDLTKISSLYELDEITTPIELKNVIVIYKTANSAIIKQKDGRSIFIYNEAKELELGKAYDLIVSKISLFYGQKQINKIETLKLIDENINYNHLFLDVNSVNLDDYNIQNEIITNLKGKFIKNRLQYNNKSIKLYAKNKNILPAQNSYIIIKKAHLSNYQGNIQLILYSKDDYEIVGSH